MTLLFPDSLDRLDFYHVARLEVRAVFWCFYLPFLSELLTHFYLQHENEEKFYIKCGIQGCQSKYRLYNSLYKHVRSKHAAFLSTAANELTDETGINFDLVFQLETDPSEPIITNEVRDLWTAGSF